MVIVSSGNAIRPQVDGKRKSHRHIGKGRTGISCRHFNRQDLHDHGEDTSSASESGKFTGRCGGRKLPSLLKDAFGSLMF